VGISPRFLSQDERISRFASRSGQIGYVNLRYPPFQLLLMSRIQSGDGAACTNAEDEEHEPFSHDFPSSLVSAPSRALLNAPYPFESGCRLCGVCAAGFG
jgi:hypothetical protein